jgi:cell division transport system permease protein
VLTTLVSILGGGARTLARRPVASLWAALAVAAALIGVAAIDVAARHVDAWSHRLRAQASMVVYLDEGAGPEHADAVAEALGAVDGVEAALVVSTADAADRLRAALGTHDALLEGVDPATLPLSIEVTLAPGLADVIGQSPLMAELRAAGAVEDVEVTRDYTAPLGEALARLQSLAWALFAIVGLAAALIVAAAVRLRVGERGGDRAALAWLGASTWFVRGPALVAGALLGAAGALLALVGAAALVHVFRVDVAPALGGAPEVAAWPLARAALLVGAGAALGVVGGALGAERAARA